VEGVDGRDVAENDHEGRKAECDGAERAMPVDAAGGDEGRLDEKESHPEGEDGSVDVEDGAGERGAHHTGAEVGRREADEDDQEDAFGGAVNRPVDGTAGQGYRRKQRLYGHNTLQNLRGGVCFRGPAGGDLRGAVGLAKISCACRVSLQYSTLCEPMVLVRVSEVGFRR